MRLYYGSILPKDKQICHSNFINAPWQHHWSKQCRWTEVRDFQILHYKNISWCGWSYLQWNWMSKFKMLKVNRLHFLEDLAWECIKLQTLRRSTIPQLPSSIRMHAKFLSRNHPDNLVWPVYQKQRANVNNAAGAEVEPQDSS